MISDLPPLNPLNTFYVAAHQESFTAAADRLGVSQAAVNWPVMVLENILGLRLFDRRQIAPTALSTG